MERYEWFLTVTAREAEEKKGEGKDFLTADHAKYANRE
jgi:hypothetical protein